MSKPAPAWLADVQARFGAAIRTPLDRSSGTLAATPAAYDAALAADTCPARLAVYNRQYWFRLLDLMHGAFPLTARVLGAWHFNDHAARFLRETPPRGWDLDRATDGFVAFFTASTAAEPDCDLLVQSARIDAAWSQVFRAPQPLPFRPTPEDAARLLDLQLVQSHAVVVVEENAPLLDLRRRLLQLSGESRVPLPARHAEPRFAALMARDSGTLQLALEPLEARLLALLCAHTVREALARLEHACAADERAQLPAKTHAWLGRGVQQGFWSGLR